MTTQLATFVQTAERDATTHRPIEGTFVPRTSRLVTAARGALGSLFGRATRGFRSGTRMSSVSVPGVDFRHGRSSSV